MGLSMVFGFAKQSDGHLSLYSEVGLGTTVKLFLPQSDGPKCRPIEATCRVAGARRCSWWKTIPTFAPWRPR